MCFENRMPTQVETLLAIISITLAKLFKESMYLLCLNIASHDLSKTTEVYVPSKNLPRCPKIVFDAHR